jgi:putative ABC transport system permease protein
MKWLIFAFKNVLRNRRRSLITIAIAAVGTAGVLIGGGFAHFTYEALRNLAARESGNVVIAHKDFWERDEDTPMQYGLDSYTDMKKKIEGDPRVRMALARVQLAGLITNGDKSAVFVGVGVEPDGEFSVKGPTMKVLSGRLLESAPSAAPAPEIVIGSELARLMKAAPGSGLTLLSTTTTGSLNAIDVVVKGVITMGVPEVDKRLVFTDLGTAQKLLLTDRVSTLSVYLRDIEQTDAMRDDMARLFPDNALQTWRDQAFYYVAVKGVYNRIFGLLGVVIVVMVLFAVSNTLAMAVIERTREIGTLRALGTLPNQIVRVFALEGCIIGSAGAATGMLFGAGTSIFFRYANFQMPPPPGRSAGYPLYVDMPPALYLATAAIVILLSVAAAWLVSRKASRKPIVEALAHV